MKATCPQCGCQIIVAGSVTLDATPVAIYWISKNDMGKAVANLETDVPHYQRHVCSGASTAAEKPKPYVDPLLKPWRAFDPANRKRRKAKK